MIDEGNWTGVVAAASRYSKVDTQTEESSDSSASESKEGQQGRKRSWFGGSSLLDKKPASAPADQDMDVDSLERTADQARKEEEDALAQAEIWMAIANQSKQEGSTGTCHQFACVRVGVGVSIDVAYFHSFLCRCWCQRCC
jgi:hypothetical protein